MHLPDTVLVTGGAHRIGAAICRHLAGAGMRVAIHANQSMDAARELAAELDGVALGADLLDPAAANELVADAAKTLDAPVDAVVNNASAFARGRLRDLDYADVDAMMRLHAWAPLAITRAAAQQGARAAVNLLDTRIIGADPAHAAYHVSKQALAGLTRSMALELAPMRINGVAPGPILAPTDGSGDNLDAAVAATVLQRAGTPEEVAEAVHFLLDAAYITGEVLFVDGGRHLR